MIKINHLKYILTLNKFIGTYEDNLDKINAAILSDIKPCGNDYHTIIRTKTLV